MFDDWFSAQIRKTAKPPSRLTQGFSGVASSC
jgi:hypothetical protein